MHKTVLVHFAVTVIKFRKIAIGLWWQQNLVHHCCVSLICRQKNPKKQSSHACWWNPAHGTKVAPPGVVHIAHFFLVVWVFWNENAWNLDFLFAIQKSGLWVVIKVSCNWSFCSACSQGNWILCQMFCLFCWGLKQWFHWQRVALFSTKLKTTHLHIDCNHLNSLGWGDQCWVHRSIVFGVKHSC